MPPSPASIRPTRSCSSAPTRASRPPSLNGRIHKRWRQGGLKVGLIGEQAALTYPYEYLGAGPQTLADLSEGRHSFAETLKEAQRPDGDRGRRRGRARRRRRRARPCRPHRARRHGGQGGEAGTPSTFCTRRPRASPASISASCPPTRTRSTRQTSSPRSAKDKLDVLYLLGADEIDLPETGSAFIVYQGSHGDKSAHRADVILPGAAYTEKSATYVNTEGRAQMTERAAFPPGEAKEDWAIIRALSAARRRTRCPTIRCAALRAAMYAAAPQLARHRRASRPHRRDGVQALAKKGSPLTPRRPFASPIADFYLTNPIARASAVMAEMSALKKSMGAAARLKAAE